MKDKNIIIPQTELINPKLLKEDKTNPNVMSVNNLKALKKTIKKYGFIIPIITNKDFLIADGFHRYKIALELKLPLVPIIKLDVSEVDRRMLRQVLNKLKGQHQLDLDLEEFKAIIEANRTDEFLSLLPDTEKELNNLIDKINQENSKEEDEFIEVDAYERAKKKCKIKQGDLFKLGNHVLMCGDSTKSDEVGLLMLDDKIDLLLTDPPYGIDIVKTKSPISKSNLPIGFNNRKGSISGGGIVPIGKHTKIIGDDKPFNPEFLLKYGKNQIIWGGNYFSTKLYDTSCWLIWDKRGEIPSNNFADCEIAWTSFKKPSRIYTHKWSGLIREGDRKEELIKRVHPTQKPVGIHEIILKEYSEEEETILDLFGGSGTTLIACEQTNRKCKMMELDPVYCQIIIDRWEKYTNKKAQKI